MKATESICDHRYIFVRQEDVSDGSHFRPTYKVIDVFYCEKCLTYKSVQVAERTANGFDSGYTTRRLI